MSASHLVWSAAVLAFVWIVLFLGWRANTQILPAAPVLISGTAVGFDAFRSADVLVGLAIAFSALILAWRFLAERRARLSGSR